MISGIKQLQSRTRSPFDLWRLDLAGSQSDIGRDLADVALRHIDGRTELAMPDGRSESALDRLFEVYCPPLHQRADGIAGHLVDIGLTASRFSLPLVQEPASFGCSAAAFSSPSGPMMLRNFDFTLQSFPAIMGMRMAGFRPMVDPVYLMKIEPTAGRRTAAMVSMDMLLGAIDGINDAGLCAALLSLAGMPQADSATRFDRFDELSIVRLLLERCSTVAETIDVFRDLPKYTVFLPCHYLVADRHGDSAVLEWDAAETRVVRGTRGDGLICTNHHLARGWPAGSLTPSAEMNNSKRRFDQLAGFFLKRQRSSGEAWRAAESVRLSAFDANADIFGGTLWTALYGLDPPRLEVRVLARIDHGTGVYRHLPPVALS